MNALVALLRCFGSQDERAPDDAAPTVLDRPDHRSDRSRRWILCLFVVAAIACTASLVASRHHRGWATDDEPVSAAAGATDDPSLKQRPAIAPEPKKRTPARNHRTTMPGGRPLATPAAGEDSHAQPQGTTASERTTVVATASTSVAARNRTGVAAARALAAAAAAEIAAAADGDASATSCAGRRLPLGKGFRWVCLQRPLRRSEVS